eukprot:g2336.t1
MRELSRKVLSRKMISGIRKQDGVAVGKQGNQKEENQGLVRVEPRHAAWAAIDAESSAYSAERTALDIAREREIQMRNDIFRRASTKKMAKEKEEASERYRLEANLAKKQRQIIFEQKEREEAEKAEKEAIENDPEKLRLERETERLMQAVREADHEMAILAIENGGDIEHRDKVGRRPVHHAAILGHARVLRVLLREGANFDSKCVYGFSPLHLALKYDQHECAEILKEAGANQSITIYYVQLRESVRRHREWMAEQERLRQEELDRLAEFGGPGAMLMQRV